MNVGGCVHHVAASWPCRLRLWYLDQVLARLALYEVSNPKAHRAVHQCLSEVLTIR